MLKKSNNSIKIDIKVTKYPKRISIPELPRMTNKMKKSD